MKKLPLNNELIEERLSFIEQSCISLDRFSSSILKKFQNNYDNYRIAFYLNDFTKFSTYIKKILINPKRYGFPEQ